MDSDELKPQRLSLERVEMITKQVGDYLHAHRPPGWRYILFFATESATPQLNGKMTYASDIARELVPGLLREVIQRLESGDYEDHQRMVSAELDELMRFDEKDYDEDEEER